MRRRSFSRASVRNLRGVPNQASDPVTLTPDDLRDKLRQALALLPEEARTPLYNKLLTGLEEASVNVASALLVLGIPARTPAELTPSDVGKLLRFVRINRPEAIAALAEPLVQLLSTMSVEPTEAAQKVRRAA